MGSLNKGTPEVSGLPSESLLNNPRRKKMHMMQIKEKLSCRREILGRKQLVPANAMR